MRSHTGNTMLSYYWAVVSLLFVVISVTPILGTPRNIIAVSVLGAFGFILSMGAKLFHRNLRLVVYIILYLSLIFLYKITGISDAAWGNYMNQVFFFMPIIMMLFVTENVHNNISHGLVYVMIAVMTFNIANNIWLSLQYPEMTLSNAGREEDELAALNMGGSYFHTFSLLFCDVCLFLFLNIKKSFVKWFWLVCVVISAVFILSFCLKASVVVILLVSIVMIVLAKTAKNTQKALFRLALFSGLILLTINIYSAEIVSYLVANSPDERLTIRLVTLIDPNNVWANQDTVDSRSELYLLSIKTWLSNPINFLFGIGDHRSATDAISTGIGQHSDFFDTLARYGILGGYLLFIILKDSIKIVLNFFDNNLRRQIIAIMIVLIICGTFKSIMASSISVVVFLLLPLSSSLLSRVIKR